MGLLSWLFGRRSNYADPECWRCRGSGREYNGYGFAQCGCVFRNIGTLVTDAQDAYNQQRDSWEAQQRQAWAEDEAARQRAGVDRATWEAHKAQLRGIREAVNRPPPPNFPRPTPEDIAAREAAWRRPVSREEHERRLREEGL